jgi:chromosomal replication initiation ATPase DnaA
MTYFVMPALRRVVAKTPAGIIREVCDRYELTEEELKSRSHRRDLVFPRHLAMYLLKEETNLTLSAIGRSFGRDHTTVIHAIKNIKDYIDTDSFGKRSEILGFFTHPVQNPK